MEWAWQKKGEGGRRRTEVEDGAAAEHTHVCVTFGLHILLKCIHIYLF